MKLASYNLHKCKGTDRRRDAGRIVKVLNGIEADVVALQEVDFRLGQRPEALPRHLVEHHTDHDPVAFATSPVSLGWHGQTILVRSGLRVTAAERIDLPGLEPRGAVMAEIEAPGFGPLRVVGVHLGLVRRYRQRQLQAIREAIGQRDQMPTAILGDFNEWSADRGLEPLQGGFDVYAPGRSFHASRPVAALDRIALTPSLQMTDAGVVETTLSRTASDHLPIWAEIAVGPQVPVTERPVPQSL